jgi:alpha-tubulin suppressor-like RCC1 family protein
MPTKSKICLSNVTMIAAGGNHNCALTSAGAIWCWGENSVGQVDGHAGNPVTTPVLITDIPVANAIVLTAQQSCALDASGNLWCWGHGSSPHQISMASAIGRIRGSNADVLCAVFVNNNVGCMTDQDPQIVLTPLFGALDIAVTANGACVLLRAAKIVCRGDNQYGQLGATITAKHI